MNRSELLIKYGGINSIRFYVKGYFQELLRVAMKMNLISLKEGVQCGDLMLEYIIKEYDECVGNNEILRSIAEYKECFIENHWYILSLYLYEKYNSPAEALIEIMNEPVSQLYKESMRYLKKVVDDIYKKLEKVQMFVKEYFVMHDRCVELMDIMSDLQNIDQQKKRFSDYIWMSDYIPMNHYELDEDDEVNYFRISVDSFLIESGILSKYSEKYDTVMEALIDFVYSRIQGKCLKLSKNKSLKDKRKIILELPSDEIFRIMFEGTDEVEFSDEQKEYLSKYFVRELEGMVFYGRLETEC